MCPKGLFRGKSVAQITSLVHTTGSFIALTATTTDIGGYSYSVFNAVHSLVASGTATSGVPKTISASGVGTGAGSIVTHDTVDTDSTVTFTWNTSTHVLGSVVITNGGPISMAGTGQGRLFSARCRMQEPNGKKFTLEGNGLDAAGAIGELEAKLALIDARVTVISAVRLTGNLSSGQITAFNTVNTARSTDAGGYDDVDITLRQVFNSGTATQVIETPVIRIQDAVNGIASTSIDGTVDVTNTLVAALATAYVDSDGNTGYAAYHGRFVS